MVVFEVENRLVSVQMPVRRQRAASLGMGKRANFRKRQTVSAVEAAVGSTMLMLP